MTSRSGTETEDGRWLSPDQALRARIAVLFPERHRWVDRDRTRAILREQVRDLREILSQGQNNFPDGID